MVTSRGFVPDGGRTEARLRSIPARRQLDDEQRAIWHFTLGRLADQQRRYDDAWAEYVAANALTRSFRPYHRRYDLANVAAVERVIDPSFVASRRPTGPTTQRPIFVVGMPRSGTTLVEQILASHPDVWGAGELTVVPDLLVDVHRRHPGPEPILDRLAALNDAEWQQLAQHLTTVYDRSAGGYPRVTDKLPGNFRHLGLLATLLPAATFVHVVRDPLDVVVSNFRQPYRGGHEYSNDLADLAEVLIDHHRLATHGRAVLPVDVHVVRYEDLVHEPVAATRALLAHCGLVWDDGCLASHETRRIVTTASRWEIRRPIHAEAIGSWRRYRAAPR